MSQESVDQVSAASTLSTSRSAFGGQVRIAIAPTATRLARRPTAAHSRTGSTSSRTRAGLPTAWPTSPTASDCDNSPSTGGPAQAAELLTCIAVPVGDPSCPWFTTPPKPKPSATRPEQSRPRVRAARHRRTTAGARNRARRYRRERSGSRCGGRGECLPPGDTRLDLRREICEWAEMIAGQAKVLVVRRPHGDWTVDPHCSTIEEVAHCHDLSGDSA